MNTLETEKNNINASYGNVNTLIKNAGGNPLEKGWARGQLTNTLDLIKQTRQQNRGIATVAGGSASAQAAQNGALGNLYANTANNISQTASSQEMQLMNAGIQNEQNKLSALNTAQEADAQRSAALTNAIISGIAGTAQTAAGAFV